MLEVIWGMYLCTCPGFSCWRLSFSVVAPSLSDNPFALDLHPHPRPSTRWGTNATVMPPSVMPSYADICFHTGDGHPAGCPRTLSLVVPFWWWRDLWHEDCSVLQACSPLPGDTPCSTSFLGAPQAQVLLGSLWGDFRSHPCSVSSAAPEAPEPVEAQGSGHVAGSDQAG